VIELDLAPIKALIAGWAVDPPAELWNDMKAGRTHSVIFGLTLEMDRFRRATIQLVAEVERLRAAITAPSQTKT
jgi:hypothetical protein